MAMFDISDDDSVAIAAPKTAKIVRGEDIAKTTARTATDAERWRYGVELRIIGSRWRPQKPAPHYPTPEPYVYRKRVHSLAWAESDHNRNIDDDYRAWLAKRDAKPEVKMADKPTGEVIPMRSPVEVPTSAPAREASVDDRRVAAAALLREIAGEYGPRREHKLRAMAEWLADARNLRRTA